MERIGESVTFSRSYHEPKSIVQISKEGGCPVNLRAQRMIAFNHLLKLYQFSKLVCICLLCINGEFKKCSNYQDHVVESSYKSQRKVTVNVSNAVKNVAKAGQDLSQFVKPKPVPQNQVQSECHDLPDQETRFFKDLDPEYSSSSQSESESVEEECIDLMLKCPLDDSNGICDNLDILPKYEDYIENKTMYERTDIIHNYIYELRNKLKKQNIGFLTSTDLDTMHQNTSMFECGNRKLIKELSSFPEISKLKDVRGPVSLLLLVYGHRNMRRQHTFYTGSLVSHDTEENRRKSKRVTPGHFITCHVNVSNGLVSVFDSLNLVAGDYESDYFCDTAMVNVICKLANTVNAIRSQPPVDIDLQRMPLQRTQNENNCGPISLLVSVFVFYKYTKFITVIMKHN